MRRTLIVRAFKLLQRALEPESKPEPAPNRVKEFVGTLHRIRGARMLFANFYAKFLQSIPEAERPCWSRAIVSRHLRRIAKVKNGARNRLLVHGLSFPEAQ